MEDFTMIGEIMGFIAGAGVETLMRQAVATITPKTATMVTKIGTKIGVWAVSGAIGLVVKDEIDDKLESIKTRVDKTKNKEKEKKLAEGEGA
jgi:hypothetical protein